MAVRDIRRLCFLSMVVAMNAHAQHAQSSINPPAPPSPPPPVRPAQISVKITPTLQVAFADRSAQPDENEKRKILELVNQLRDAHVEVIVIVGHADPAEGNDSAELMRISMDRASNIRSLIIGMGMDANRIYSNGAGGGAGSDGKKSELGHRRAVVEVVGTVRR